MGEKVVHARKDGKVEKVEKSRAGPGWRGGQCGEEDVVDCGVICGVAAMVLGNKLVGAIGSNI